MMAEKSDQSIRVIKKYGTVTGKEMFRVKGDVNGWCASPQAAVDQYYKCQAYWKNYHSQGGKK